MKKILTTRLEEPYTLAVQQFKNQGPLIEQALDNHPDKEFRRELAKQKEVYDRTSKKLIKRKEAIGQEFNVAPVDELATN